jgi:O-succinylbenzoic acid--CoA ligase
MFSPDFWTSPSCHVALNPQRLGDADGLLPFALQRGWVSKCFFQTSGTEGLPKWVSLSKSAFLISAQAVNAHFEVHAGDRWLVALPLHHVGGFSIVARAHLSGSQWVQQTGRWSAQTFVDQCENESITLASLVPTQVHDLVVGRFRSPTHLRAVIVGGGGMSETLAKSAQALGWPVFQSYGMTEAASQIATQAMKSAWKDGLQILPHWQVNTDSEGHLLLSGPALAEGYLSKDTKGNWTWSEIGPVLKTRDLVQLSQHEDRRFLHFIGRESGVIKLLGELVHLAPLQARLDQIVLEAGSPDRPIVAALPDARREMKLVMVADSDQAETWLKAFNAGVSSLYQISEIRRLPAIPRTELGKVDHAALAVLLTRP